MGRNSIFVTVNENRCVRFVQFSCIHIFISRLILITLIMRSFPILKMLLGMRLSWGPEMCSTSPCIGKKYFWALS